MAETQTTEYKPKCCDECFLWIADDVNYFCNLYEQHIGEDLKIRPDFCKIVVINILED